MVATRKAVLFGFLLWAIAFVVAFAIFPIRGSSRPLFESIMPVVLAGATVFFAHRYFKGVRARFSREGLLLGLLWFGVNVAIDLPLMLTPSPMQMSLSDYVADIGLTYALIPIITTGMGFARAQGGSSAPE
jgi:uncharacterized membrane protein YpjA